MNTPPRMARALLKLFSVGSRAEEVRGDFEEAYERWARVDARVASRRYWREVLHFGFRRVFGGVGGSSTADREAPGVGRVNWARDLSRDARYAFRTLRRAPVFTAVAVIILALGIGANATMFTLVNDLFFRPPALVEAPEELVRFDRVRANGSTVSFGYADYAFFRDNNDVFAGVLAYDDAPATAVVGTPETGDVSQASVTSVSANYFHVLGVTPSLGRAFLEAEGRTPLTHPVVMLNHGFWRRYFGSDPDVVNRTIDLNGRSFTIVGVLPRAFRGASPVEPPTDLYIPIMMQGAVSPGAEGMLTLTNGNVSYWLTVIGRMRPGIDVERAQANMDVVRARFLDEYAGWVEATTPNPFRVGLHTTFQLGPGQRDSLRQLARLLFAVVGAVLVIASVNLALLLLARSTARYRELGIRLALGSGRGRVIRQNLVESFMLAGCGALGGLVLATWGARVAASLMPMQFAVDFRPDGTVLLFTLGVAFVTAMAFGLLPARQAASSDAVAALHRGEPEFRRSRGRHALVVAQFALSIALVTGAGLFVRSLRTAQSVDLGFDPENKLTLSVHLGNHGYTQARGLVFLRSALETMRGIPGVTMVSAMQQTPFRGAWGSGVRAPGTQYEEQTYDSGFNRVGPDYFAAMSIDIVAGREFTDADTRANAPMAIVNEVLADALWPGESAVGKIIERGRVEMTVIGVARTAMYYEVGEDPGPQIYIPYFQQYSPRITFLLATQREPETLAPVVEDAIRGLDPTIAVFRTRTLGQVVGEEVGRYRAMAILVTLFGSLALLLAAVGQYGVQAYLVTRRTREIGVRLALGAHSRQVASQVIGRGLLFAAVGTAIGLTAAFGLANLLEGMLYGVSARDPLTFAVVPFVLLAVSLLANVIPARRASRVDPMVALREE